MVIIPCSQHANLNLNPSPNSIAMPKPNSLDQDLYSRTENTELLPKFYSPHDLMYSTLFGKIQDGGFIMAFLFSSWTPTTWQSTHSISNIFMEKTPILITITYCRNFIAPIPHQFDNYPSPFISCSDNFTKKIFGNDKIFWYLLTWKIFAKTVLIFAKTVLTFSKQF